MKTVFIFYQRQRVRFTIPDNWNLLSFPDFPDNEKSANVNKLTKEALNKPIQSPALNDLLSPTDSIAIIIEDLTRTSPKRLILKVVLDNLNEIGIPEKNINIIIATGTHRGLKYEELESAFSRDLLYRYAFSNHDCRASDLVPIGMLKTGCEVKINRKVFNADFRIGIGSISPHPMNGFGGGGKIIFPGVTDFYSTLEHHLKWTFHKGTGLGKLKENFFYDEVNSMARAGKLNFIINTVLNQSDEVDEIVCGDFKQAHLKGIGRSRAIISHRFPKKSDLTIITSFPYFEGPQIVKPLIPASMVTKEGGCIILVADCTGNLPDEFIDSFESFHSKYGHNLLGGVMEYFENNRLIMDGGAIDFNMALGLTLALQHRFKIILVSKDIQRVTGEKMGFLYADNLEQAFELSETVCTPNPEVHVIPSGGVILPVI
jgi:nickel-dependent lactate racemase